MNIGRTLKYGFIKLKRTPKLELGAKAAGVTAACIALGDAHHWAKMKAREQKTVANGNAGYEYFVNTQYSPNRSHTTSKLKQKMFHCELENNIRGSWNYFKGYVKGLGSQLWGHGLTIAGAGLALCCKGKKSVAGLALLGLTTLNSVVRNLCGHIGHEV